MSDLEFTLLLGSIVCYIIIGNIVFQLIKLSHYKIFLPENRKGNLTYLEMQKQCDEYAASAYYIDKVASYFWPITIFIYLGSTTIKLLLDGLIIKD